MAYHLTMIRKKMSRISRPNAFLLVLTVAAAVAGFLLFNLPDVYSGDYSDDLKNITKQRESAQNNYNDGNYKEAFVLYSQLLERPVNDSAIEPGMVGNDLNMAVNCLNNLNRVNETDALREKTIEHHADNWQLLWSAAQNYQYTDHSGYMIAGKFERGSHRGGGRYVNAMERDRVRALQLMVQAMEIAETDANDASVAGFYQAFAGMWLLNRYNNQASWELQALTDLSVLPDYEEGYSYWGGETRGAAVDESGNPVFYQIPASFESAKNDGERWRWCLKMAVEKNPGLNDSALWTMANFFKQQFGVQTMASFSWWGRSGDMEDVSGTFSVHTLADDESIAKLATGIQRFNLPAEFNYITIYETLAENQKGYQENALQTLADIYTNRRLYEKAAGYWQQVLNLPSCSEHTYQSARKKLSQIVDNWGQFEPVMSQAYKKNKNAKGATVEFRFRNADHVDFEAYEIKVPQLLEDVKKYIKKRPNKMDWQKVNVNNIGWRLVENNEKKYIGKKAAGWSMTLTPRKGHWDRRETIETPLKKAGAYLLKATLAGGHTSRIVIWLNDTVIVHKPLNKKNMYYAADAVTGEPLSHINLEFFGYRHHHVKRNRYDTDIRQFAEYTDKNGLVMPGSEDQAQNYQWLITATGDDEGRFAFLGFNSVWHGNWYDQAYNQTKVLTITDRPVYRPAQPVKFKQWVGQAKYDQDDVSFYANQSMSIEIRNPKGDRVYEKTLTADAYGGIHGEFEIPSDAALGVYQVYNHTYGSGGTFRVEEYKKPEFEVMVTAPEEPVMLGETIAAEIKAAYYFGEPVKEGTVKYKILRYEHTAQWFPHGKWDWFYDPGYWWFAYDYAWYPGWKQWGCFAPWPWWMHRGTPPPEVVAELESEIPEDGIIKVKIDTRLAKEMHGDKDHRYEITAEVTDLSRRTIAGKGEVLAARQPFKVYAWVDRGHYRTGDTIRTQFSAQTLDRQPVKGKGVLTLFKVSYDKNMQPKEKPVAEWKLDTDAQGNASQQLTASSSGQYRLSFTVTDAKDHKIEGGYVFSVMGDTADKAEKNDFRFDHIELVTDKREYKPGENVRLRINTDRKNSTVALFIRPANGVYLAPKIIRIKGKSTLEKIPITKKDMPNFFVEAFTVSDGKLFSTTREIIVPPEKRVLNMDVAPSSTEFKPGEDAVINIKLTDAEGEPFVGSTVITVYDKALEYISGGSNVPDIRKFFWKWRRSHREVTVSNLTRYFYNLIKSGEQAMVNLGVFGHMVADMETDEIGRIGGTRDAMRQNDGRLRKDMPMSAAPMKMKAGLEKKEAGFAMAEEEAALDQISVMNDAPQTVAPVIRKKFADTAFWAADVITDKTGSAQVTLTMPDNLTGWKVKTWAMGHGTKVAEAETLITTKKNLMVRLQAPRFFIEKDEVVLSANVHNYLKTGKSVSAVIEMDGDCLELMSGITARQVVDIEAGGEKRLDWRVKVVREGAAVIRMKALTDIESDAMEMTFPVYVHGADKMEAWSGYIDPDSSSQAFAIHVPEDRRKDSARLEIRYSPTLAGAMVDALPYLVDYPYGCTEQTLNRFLPTVITQKVLLTMGLDLSDIEQKRSNLNAQEIGDNKQRAAQWKKDENTRDAAGNLIPKNPVFDEREVVRMVKVGVRALTQMQLSDGGWGWFSGYRERSWAHTTAYVVHGLQVARDNDVALVPGVLERGIKWLVNYEAEQVRLMKSWDSTNKYGTGKKGKSKADNLDAFVYMVLTDAGHPNEDMGKYLYRDRNHLSVYAKSMAGMAYHTNEKFEMRDMMIQNIEQYLVRDDENQSAYLNLGNNSYWWYWYGSEYEAHAYYLKLLAKTGNVSDWKAPYLVKYLLNNRKHATYWKSTRDTAIVIEAFADYLKATRELQPDQTLEIFLDGKSMKEVVINSANLFMYDNQLVLSGREVTTGDHKIEIHKKGRGPIYFNAYLSYFSLEDFIGKSGLEVKVNRKVYKLTPMDKSIKVSGSRGQALDQKVEKFERRLLDNHAVLKSGDLVEVELVIDSKNDYEYLVFEDFKAAGFEAVDVRSGYTGNEMGAYVEFRDNRVAFFVRQLARGKHSVSYRLRAEIPGRFSALPAQGYAMYAPELRGNSDEIKLNIMD